VFSVTSVAKSTSLRFGDLCPRPLQFPSVNKHLQVVNLGVSAKGATDIEILVRMTAQDFLADLGHGDFLGDVSMVIALGAVKFVQDMLVWIHDLTSRLNIVCSRRSVQSSGSSLRG